MDCFCNDTRHIFAHAMQYLSCIKCVECMQLCNHSSNGQNIYETARRHKVAQTAMGNEAKIAEVKKQRSIFSSLDKTKIQVKKRFSCIYKSYFGYFSVDQCRVILDIYMHTIIFCSYSEEGNILFIPFPWLMNTALLFPFSAVSIHEFLLICKSAVVLLPLCTLVATIFPLLHNHVLQAVLIADVREKRDATKAITNHREMLVRTEFRDGECSQVF